MALNAKQTAFLGRVKEALEAHGLDPQHPKTLARELHVPVQAIEEIMRLGVQSGDLVRAGEYVFSQATLADLASRVRADLGPREFREQLGLSRSVADALFSALRDD